MSLTVEQRKRRAEVALAGYSVERTTAPLRGRNQWILRNPKGRILFWGPWAGPLWRDAWMILQHSLETTGEP